MSTGEGGTTNIVPTTSEEAEKDVELQKEKKKEPEGVIENDNDNNNKREEDGGEEEDKEKDKKEGGEGEKKEKEKEKLPPVPWCELFRYADTCDKVLLAVGTVLAIAAGAGMPAFSELFGQLLNEMSSPTGALDQINKLAWIMAVVGVARGVLGYFAVAFFMIPCERQAGRIRSEYLEALLRQDMEFHDDAKPGALTACLVGDIQIYRNGINDKLGMGILQFSMFICGYGLAFYRHARLSAVSVAVMPLVGIAATVWRKYAVAFVEEARVSYRDAGEVSDEAFQNFRTLQILGLEKKTIARFEAALEKGRWPGFMKDFTANAAQATVMFVMFSCYALVFWYASVLIRNKEADIGTLATVFFAVMVGSFGLVNIFPTLGGLTEAAGSIAKVYSVLEKQPKIISGTRKLDNFRGEIVFEDVDFVYPSRPDMKLFNKFNLKIEAGRSTACAGQSGSGKSTIFGLLQRLYDPDGGRVLIDGVDLKELDLTWFREQIGVVSQDTVLFSGTVKDNIVFGTNITDMDTIEAAAKQANIHESIMNFPEQYDTNVGSGGAAQMSGGQKQRIAIARALIRKPKILVLDEATSALDRESEMLVQGAIDELIKQAEGNLTCAVISHRMITIRNCSKIYFLERDEAVGTDVLETGSYDELIKKNGHFASMASRQAASSQLLNEDQNKMFGAAQQAATAAAGGGVGAGGDEMISSRQASEQVLLASRQSTETELKSRTPSNTSFASNKVIGEGGGEDGPSPTVPGQAGGAADAKKEGEEEEEEVEEEVEVDDGKGGKTKIKKKKTKQTYLKHRVEVETEGAHSGLWRTAELMEGYKWQVYLAMLGSFLVGGQMPFYAVVFSKTLEIMGQRTPAQIEEEIPLWLGMFVVVAGIALVGGFLQAFYAAAGENLTTQIRIMTFQAILKQDATFFDMPGRDPGGLQGLLSGDCESVHQLFGPAIGPVIQLFSTFGAGLGISFYYSWKLALVILSTIPILVFAGSLRNRMYSGFSAKEGEKSSSASIFGETMTNIRTIVVFNAQNRQKEFFEKADAQSREEGIYLAHVAGISFGFMQFAITCIFALGLWYGGTLIKDGELTFLDVMISMMAILMSGMNAGESAGLLAKQKDAALGSKKVFAVIDRIPDVNSEAQDGLPNNFFTSNNNKQEGDESAEKKQHLIDFDNVHFTYPARESLSVLNGLSQKFLLPATGQSRSIGVIGSTGSGKSTIVQLIARFYDPTREDMAEIHKKELKQYEEEKKKKEEEAAKGGGGGGGEKNDNAPTSVVSSSSNNNNDNSKDKEDSILIDGTKLRRLDVKSWRSRIAAVFQEPSLFSGTVRENILHGVEDPDSFTQEDIEKYAKLAAVHEDILGFDDKYEHAISFQGRNISGGQKQRIAIARALARKCPILLLDEATSALDQNTEARVVEGIAKAQKEVPMLVISIAHRLSVLTKSDEIILLDRGVILESGSHDELMKKGGEYKKRYDLFVGANDNKKDEEKKKKKKN